MINYNELRCLAKEESLPKFDNELAYICQQHSLIDTNEIFYVHIPREFVKDMSLELDRKGIHNFCFDDGLVVLGRNYMRILKCVQGKLGISDGTKINWDK